MSLGFLSNIIVIYKKKCNSSCVCDKNWNCSNSMKQLKSTSKAKPAKLNLLHWSAKDFVLELTNAQKSCNGVYSRQQLRRIVSSNLQRNPLLRKAHYDAEVESRSQGSRPRPRTQKKSEAKAKDTKKSEAKAKDSLSEDRPSRGQGQECSRPRTKVTGASVLQKKKFFKKVFQAISNL